MSVNQVASEGRSSRVVSLPGRVSDQPPALDRIRRLSRPLAWLFTVAAALALILLLGAVATVLIYEGSRVQVRPGGLQIFIEPTPPRIVTGWTTLASMPWLRKLALAGSAALMLTPAIAVLWTLRRLFRLYAQGVVLAVDNARCIALIAAWLIAYAVAPTLGHLLVTAAGFHDEGWLRMDSFQALGLGLVLFVIARVMRWGAEIADDAARFV